MFLLSVEAPLFQKHRGPNLEPPSDRRVRVFSACAVISALGAAGSAGAVLGAAWSWGFEQQPLIAVQKSEYTTENPQFIEVCVHLHAIFHTRWNQLCPPPSVSSERLEPPELACLVRLHL